jgi:hypothetical protein
MDTEVRSQLHRLLFFPSTPHRRPKIYKLLKFVTKFGSSFERYRLQTPEVLCRVNLSMDTNIS